MLTQGSAGRCTQRSAVCGGVQPAMVDSVGGASRTWRAFYGVERVADEVGRRSSLCPSITGIAPARHGAASSFGYKGILQWRVLRLSPVYCRREFAPN